MTSFSIVSLFLSVSLTGHFNSECFLFHLFHYFDGFLCSVSHKRKQPSLFDALLEQSNVRLLFEFVYL